MGRHVKKWWLEIGLIEKILIALALVFIVGTIGFLALKCTTLDQAIEVIRNLTLALVGLGGLYGLVLATKRQEKFSQQVENAQAQLFNDRLGRGVELLDNKDAALRAAGVEVLDNLAESASEREIKLIVNILYRYLNTRASTITEDETGNIMPKTQKPRGERVDIELCVKVILKYATEREKRVFDELAFEGLDFADVDFSLTRLSRTYLVGTKLHNANLEKINLQRAQMARANLTKANLKGANLQDTNLIKANLASANMTEANLHDAYITLANLSGTNLAGAKLSHANMEKTDLSGADLTGAILKNVSLEKAHLQNSNLTKADLEAVILIKADLSRTNLRNIKNLTQKQFNQIVFEKSKPPTNIPDDLNLPEDRAYVLQKGMRMFIKSDKPWSEQNVVN